MTWLLHFLEIEELSVKFLGKRSRPLGVELDGIGPYLARITLNCRHPNGEYGNRSERSSNSSACLRLSF